MGRKPYLPLHAYLIQEMENLGFLMRGEIIWNKAASAGSSTAWGSWKSAANPTLRDVHEYILVFSKGAFRRANLHKRPSTITRDEFLEYTKSVWAFGAESAQKIGHPAPFLLELPYRLVQLYTFAGEVVLDPFLGSGQTAIAALQAGRHYVGYEINPVYAALAEVRIVRPIAKNTPRPGKRNEPQGRIIPLRAPAGPAPPHDADLPAGREHAAHPGAALGT